MKKANVLLLMCDQFRGDCLSIAHHPDVKTPYLDSLAMMVSYLNRPILLAPAVFPLALLC